ncbi:4a-hydroxytetrahydrobiopterin dehydratase [Candidatus Bipolaricaulota bacterium]|nr:4a-hydroxytetrahydrobiopterin dehydratase [Candidatus Bipolaricaulota bacterium]MBS3825745.1 4a-hydroxytetrahydrobiopterin dehydratase [Candidatus Bipolaricaulota bacterium]
MEDLTSKECVPCEGGVPPLESEEVEELLTEVRGWELLEETQPKIRKEFKFGDFKESMGFVNEIAKLAEKEGHHPDIEISYNVVTLELYTHAIDGLHENDFILAAKVDELAEE